MFNKSSWYDEREGVQDWMLEDPSSTPGPLHKRRLLDLCLNWEGEVAFREHPI